MLAIIALVVLGVAIGYIGHDVISKVIDKVKGLFA